jgi:hypothetical protein
MSGLLALTITVNKAAPTVLTVPAADFTLGQAGSVTVVATGRPVPKIILQRHAGIAKTKLPSIHAGQKVHFVVKTYGYPIPTLSTKGQLPKGLAFTQLAQGKATIAGTPPKGWSGKRYLNVTASNSLGNNMTHHYVVTVGP